MVLAAGKAATATGGSGGRVVAFDSVALVASGATEKPNRLGEYNVSKRYVHMTARRINETSLLSGIYHRWITTFPDGLGSVYHKTRRDVLAFARSRTLELGPIRIDWLDEAGLPYTCAKDANGEHYHFGHLDVAIPGEDCHDCR